MAVCFTILVAGAGVLTALDRGNAKLYFGAIALLAVISGILVLGALARATTSAPLQETYAKVMIALVTGAAGTGAGVGGGVVASQGPQDTADEAQKDANVARVQAKQAKEQVKKVTRKSQGGRGAR
jgi:glucose dehydrogenase